MRNVENVQNVAKKYFHLPDEGDRILKFLKIIYYIRRHYVGVARSPKACALVDVVKLIRPHNWNGSADLGFPKKLDENGLCWSIKNRQSRSVA